MADPTNNEFVQAAAALLAGGGGIWATVRAYLKLAEKKDKNKTALQLAFEKALEGHLARSDKEIERLHQRLTATEDRSAQRANEQDNKIELLTREVARLRSELDTEMKRSAKYAAKYDHSEKLVQKLTAEKGELEARREAEVDELKTRIAELEAEVAALKAAAGDPSLHAHRRATDPASE
jgi:polyhydroxyalkanoate synthesis regulator phasin